MLSSLIIVIILLQIILALFIIKSLIRKTKKIEKANEELLVLKKDFYKISDEFRIFLKSFNKRAEDILTKEKLKKITNTLNTILSVFVALKLKNKKVCK